VPIAAVLRDYLDQHLISLPWSKGLVFGRTSADPFDPSQLPRKARLAWGWKRASDNGEREWVKARQDALEPITPHECRHTFASLMIAAGVNAKALSSYLGHSSIQITFDRYGHLMPGNEDEAAQLLDGYPARASVAPVFAPVASESDATQRDSVRVESLC
jgi:integrase